MDGTEEMMTTRKIARKNALKGACHPTLSVLIWHLDGKPMLPKHPRKVFRKYPSPTYGTLQNGTVVQFLQIGMTNMHRWYLKGSPFNDDGRLK
jgi:hypothetical protein